ncbi:MAG: DUF4375 domain-containing protein [Acidobacteria bacterium]|nr:DUF4375 domain-containing protein [Acidobacteriota bacterium]
MRAARHPRRGILELLQIEDDTQLVRALVRHAQCRMGWRRLTRAEQVLHDVAWLAYAVDEGGFFRYFWMDRAARLASAMRGLQAIGAESTLRVVAAAAAACPGGRPPRNWRERRHGMKVLRRPSPHFDSFDEAFWNRTDDLVALLARYAREHRAEFRDI